MAELDRFDEERALYDGEPIELSKLENQTSKLSVAHSRPKCLTLVVGESGSGKDTIVQEAVRRTGWHQAMSYTTRRPRYKGENTHYFVSEEDFEALSLTMAAITEFDGNKYGCTYDELNSSCFYVVDVKGAQDILKAVEKGKIRRPVKIAYIFAFPDVRMKRMMARGDSYEDAVRRIEHDEVKFKNIAVLQLEIIFNMGDINDAVHALISLLTEQNNVTINSVEEPECLYANGSPLELRL